MTEPLEARMNLIVSISEEGMLGGFWACSYAAG